jgi:hypothetical protein
MGALSNPAIALQICSFKGSTRIPQQPRRDQRGVVDGVD